MKNDESKEIREVKWWNTMFQTWWNLQLALRLLNISDILFWWRLTKSEKHLELFRRK